VGGTGTNITRRQREDILRQEYGKDYTPPPKPPTVVEPRKMGKSLDPAVAARMNTQPISRRGYISHPVVGTGMRNDRISENFNKSQSAYSEGTPSRRIGHLRPLVKGDGEKIDTSKLSRATYKDKPLKVMTVEDGDDAGTGHRHLKPGEMAKLEAEMAKLEAKKKNVAGQGRPPSK
jgi:hypothetical protein